MPALCKITCVCPGKVNGNTLVKQLQREQSKAISSVRQNEKETKERARDCSLLHAGTLAALAESMNKILSACTGFHHSLWFHIWDVGKESF